MLVLVSAGATAAGASAAQPATRPSVSKADIAPLSEAYLARAKARAALKNTAWPAGVQYQHLETATDGSLTVVVTGDASAKAKSSALTATVSEKLRAASVNPDVKVRFAAIPDKTLNTAVDQLSDFKAWAGDLAPLVNLVTADTTKSVVTIGSTVKSAELERRATARFKVPLRFVISQPMTRAGRYNDTAPWDAGNALTHVVGDIGQVGRAHCTQGFSWQRWSDNLNYASSAGHCWTINTNVFNGDPSQRIGYVAGRWFANFGPTDFELIRPTVGYVTATAWIGGPQTSDLRVVAGADNVNSDENIGADVCFSGANGGTHCGEITDANVTRGFNDGTSTRDLTCVKMPAGNIVGGDSGGPVLSTYSNGKVHAWGQTVGTQADANCAAVYTPVLAISAAVGATILVNP
ncbi:hypothetical protein AB0E63_38125 [Kribbella sp. NPDC026596]|uniref:hypothetical protein n=1 Tax=Kribbella sp. NPDC026596 TaxID=3155122 RepID=UPI0033DAB40B